jgi:hypothetical protein
MDHKLDKEKFEKLMKFALETAIGGKDKITVDTDEDWDVTTGKMHFIHIFIKITGDGDDMYTPQDIQFELSKYENKISRVINNPKFIFDEFGEFGKKSKNGIEFNGPMILRVNIDPAEFESQWVINVQFDN